MSADRPEHVAHDPWKVLVAVTLLNKTAGKLAVPAFFKIMALWPTAQALARAPPDVLEGLIKHLGLGRSRTARLIKMSRVYIEDPPAIDHLRPTKCYMNVCVRNEAGEPSLVKQRYPPTAISHVPGSGPYALDSYRIFCVGDDEWKSVFPQDKELVKYLKWKWAVAELRQWDELRGPGEFVDIQFLDLLCADLLH